MGKKTRNNRPGQRAGSQHQGHSQPRPAALPAISHTAQIQGDPKASEDSSGTTQHDKEQDAKMDTFVLVNVVLTAVIMAATVTQAVVAYYQWAMMKRGADQTDRVIELMTGEQRAWITFGTPGMRVDKDGDLEFFVPLTNSGKSPASVIFWSFGAFVSTEPTEDIEKAFHYDDIDPDDAPRWAMNISHGDTIRPSKWMDGYDESHIAAIKSGKENAVLFGWIVYEDKFRRYPPTKWCFHFDHETGTFQPDYYYHQQPEYEYDDEGNIVNPQ